jgi:sirohydrochlorin cobaltochelatase
MNSTHLPLWAEILLEDPGPQRMHAAQRGRRKGAATELSDSDSLPVEYPRGSCLVLMAHGSKDPRWCGTFECLYEYVHSRYGGNIRLAYMEFVGPTLMDVARDCAAQGVGSVRVLPLFMAGGAHVATDIPEQMAQVRETFPAMKIEAMAPIGEDPRMFAVIQEIIGRYALDPEYKFTAA